MCARGSAERTEKVVPGKAGPWLVLLIFLSMSMASCGRGLRGSQASSQPWTVGFWLWQGAEFDVAAAGNRPFDVLYVQVGRVDSYWKNSVSWPLQAQMPPAKEFWALWRYDPPARPAEAQIPMIAGDFEKRRAEAAGRGQTLVGVQLDFDCPTGDLAEYASFLEMLGKALPAGTRLSITALLDWFRAGTEISDVLAHASEFVPQFYDAAMSPEGRLRAIAEPIDAARWGSVFNSFKIPYRVGISTFGRIAYNGKGGAQYYRELTPLDILGLPGLRNVSSGPTPGGEQRSVFQAERSLKLNYWTVLPGDQIELIMPTRTSVLSAYDAVKQMGGLCAGVLFFRWPTYRESMVINPATVLGWVSRSEALSGPPGIEVDEGDCAAVTCSDLSLRIADCLPDHAAVYRIQSSRPFEYFVPDPRIKSRISVTGASSLRLELPAFHGAAFLYLGRAVTLDPAQFTVTEGK